MDTCRAIAQSFGLPLETVMRRAGLLPDEEERTDLASVRELASGLNDANLKTLLAVAQALSDSQARVFDRGYFHVVGFPDLEVSSIEGWQDLLASLPDSAVHSLRLALEGREG